ncbi:hypothetical protein V5O48_007504, partial [Marasmius crinis-equi]
MKDLVRDAVIGQIINYLSGGRLLSYPEQKPEYQVPARYLSTSRLSPASTAAGIISETKHESLTEKKHESQLNGGSDSATVVDHAPLAPTHRPGSAEDSNTLTDATANPSKDPEQGQDAFLVDWDGPNDPDNPKNWSSFKKGFVAFEISLLTFSVYIGSAIFTPSFPGVRERFGATEVEAALGLTLYVLAYGIGPMFLTPLQEIPSLGRNPVYIIGLAIFLLLQIPIVDAKNLSTIWAFRFLTGFVGSPALATGGASMADIFDGQRLPYMIGIWGLGAVAGPISGPVIGGFAAQAKDWRWPIYELMWISAFALGFLSLLLPETLGANILLKRAKRLRKATGNPRLRSQSELDQAAMSKKDVAFEALFEAFPLVFNGIYHMSLGVGNLPFAGFVVSGAITYTAYCLYLRYHFEPRSVKNPMLAAEARLEIGLIASVFIPISLFMFGWSARPDVH